MTTAETVLRFIRVPNTDTQYLICNQRKYRHVYTSKKTGQKSWICACSGCKCTIHTLDEKFSGYGSAEKAKHNPSVQHALWSSLKQDKNDLLVDMTDDIVINGTSIHQSFQRHCVDNPEESKSISHYGAIRKVLLSARNKSGITELPKSGQQATQLLLESMFCRNH